MNIRPFAEFTSDLPEDHIDDGEEIIKFGGESVTRAIAEMLVRCGCKLDDEPYYLHERGWELGMWAGKRRLSCRISLIEGYVIGLHQVWWLGSLLGRTSKEYIRVLKQFSGELANDPRFHDVRWYTNEDLLRDLPGTDSPVID